VKSKLSHLRPKGLHIVTMGCQMNVYDSQQMERLLEPMNYRPARDPEKADLILLNTCSIREKAEHKVYSLLGRLARLKRKKPGLIIGVGGCVAQQEGRRILERAPHVDIVFGTFALRRIPRLVWQVIEKKRRVVDIGATELVEPPCIRPSQFQRGRATAFVTIMTGCDNFCTYCVVPYVRGREVSRRPEAILKEIQYLVEAGVREITLLGQNVNAYGMKKGHGCDFPTLLEAVNGIEGLKRIRFTTSHPKDLSDALIAAFGSLNKLAPHIHLPVQSGSDRVLKHMNRNYTRDYYLERVESLRNVRPDIAITSDIIVGFPGEEEIDFKETLSLVETVGFDNLYIFKYSDRPNVAASRFANKVPDDIKSERFSRLLELQAGVTLRKNRSVVGTIQEVLVEGLSKKSDEQVTGRTPCNMIVNFPGTKQLIGELVPVKIEKAFSHSLFGFPVNRREDHYGRKGGTPYAA